MQTAIKWLRARADNVAVGLLAAMFLSFVLQIFTRYVLQHPLAWTVEACVTFWIWIVFWGCAFVLDESEHVKFDILYLAAGVRLRRVFALVSAVAVLVSMAAALPRTIDYLLFLKIKKSAILEIPLDLVFSIYGVFAVAIVIRYALRVWHLSHGSAAHALARIEVK
ncbi:TRAP transporter small permease [Rhodoferax sp.]|uniref:TRAP transporter small permease n=1 Tax=Rhodoferax sp. TaxID=50421 RepID=UPI0027195659|nr:TRAP transporter small permease subunit [Rhodoferax sp.]MDO8319420.1 TRAP transporter small permease subunit [Rhodoferax sp.]